MTLNMHEIAGNALLGLAVEYVRSSHYVVFRDMFFVVLGSDCEKYVKIHRHTVRDEEAWDV